MKKTFRNLFSFLFYLIPFASILVWWTVAFRSAPIPASLTPDASIIQKKSPSPSILKYLSTMQREQLHKALSGDYHLMIKLITDWDHDAQIMEQMGFKEIKRLSTHHFLRCQLLARQINSSSSAELNRLHDDYRSEFIPDDIGNLFDLSKSYGRFLPQSYVAASFLLALCEPESIVALPKGMREQKSIYPIEITRLIKLDADRYNTEKLYEAKPDIAFIADYSHPSTIQALQRQNIPLFTLKHIQSPEDIQDALIRIGNVINRPLEAELLSFFVEAAMQAIDNRFKVLNTTFNAPHAQPRVLFLKHHLTFSTPTSRTLTGKLLKRMGVKSLIGDETSQNKFAWTVPLYQEQILDLNPDYIIIAANPIDTDKNNTLKESLLQNLIHQQKIIAFVDDTVQESPSQYLVLAYYDIFEALTPVICP